MSIVDSIVRIGDLWWPTGDDPMVRAFLSFEVCCVEEALPLMPGNRVAVQAGGHVGMYPIALARYFQQVLTFEPCATNFKCLRRNLDERNLSHVEARHAGLGSKLGTMNLKRSEKNSGGHCMDGSGEIEMLTIDGLQLSACDLIWLDVEGVELPALQGALSTIARFSPAIFIEDKGMSEQYGIKQGAVVEAMRELGYRIVGTARNDIFMARGL